MGPSSARLSGPWRRTPLVSRAFAASRWPPRPRFVRSWNPRPAPTPQGFPGPPHRPPAPGPPTPDPDRPSGPPRPPPPGQKRCRFLPGHPNNIPPRAALSTPGLGSARLSLGRHLSPEVGRLGRRERTLSPRDPSAGSLVARRLGRFGRASALGASDGERAAARPVVLRAPRDRDRHARPRLGRRPGRPLTPAAGPPLRRPSALTSGRLRPPTCTSPSPSLLKGRRARSGRPGPCHSGLWSRGRG